MGLPFVNPAKMAKQEILKMDLNKNHIPDVLEGLDGAEAAIDSLQEFVADFDEGEAAAFLKVLNECRRPEKKKSDQELHEIAKQIVNLPSLLGKVETILENSEKFLKE